MKFTRKNLALFSFCEKIGLRVSARIRKMGNGSLRLCLEVFYTPKNEYKALSEKIENNELGDAIFTTYLKYYTMLREKGTIKFVDPNEVIEEFAPEPVIEKKVKKPKPNPGEGSMKFNF